jgi:hypothetical protein
MIGINSGNVWMLNTSTLEGKKSFAKSFSEGKYREQYPGGHDLYVCGSVHPSVILCWGVGVRRGWGEGGGEEGGLYFVGSPGLLKYSVLCKCFENCTSLGCEGRSSPKGIQWFSRLTAYVLLCVVRGGGGSG